MHRPIGNVAEGDYLRALQLRLEAADRLAFEAASPLKVKRWLRAGELDTEQVKTTADIYWQAIDLMDNACSHDIVGLPLFEGEDANYYVGELSFGISPADPDFVKAELE